MNEQPNIQARTTKMEYFDFARLVQTVLLLLRLLSVDVLKKSGATTYDIREKPACTFDMQVCQTIMRLPEGETLEEDPYCNCAACSHIYDENDPHSMTWVHHEKRDWMVQYKFCKQIEVTRGDEHGACVGDETALLLETDTSKWNPRLRQARCRCNKTTSGEAYEPYKLVSWQREGNKWVYSYSCKEKEICKPNNPCVRHYFDRAGQTNQYKFYCSCATNSYCPTDHDNKEGRNRLIRDRSTGDDYNEYCCARKIPRDKERGEDKANKRKDIGLCTPNYISSSDYLT